MTLQRFRALRTHKRQTGDVTPPTISNVAVSNITVTAAVVSWSLSEGATGQVFYGTSPTNLSSSTTKETSTSLTAHIQSVSGLSENTTYYFKVESIDAAGNVGQSSVGSFQTLDSAPSPGTFTDYTVPASITSDGSVSVNAALNSWIAGRPSGTSSTSRVRLIFPSGSHYLISESLYFSGLRYANLEGYGCKIEIAASAQQWQYTSGLYLGLGSILDMRVYGFELESHSALRLANEDQQAIYLGTGNQVPTGYEDIEIYDIHAYGFGGDFIKHRNGRNNWVHDCHAHDMGRQFITTTQVFNFLVEDCTVGNVDYYYLDTEPNDDTQITDGVTFRNNTFYGRHGESLPQHGGFMAFGNSVGAYWRNITVTGNTVTGPSNLRTYINNRQRFVLGDTYQGIPKISNVTISGNSSPTSMAGPALYINAVNGLTVTNNYQELSSGSLTSPSTLTSNNTNVTYSGNTT